MRKAIYAVGLVLLLTGAVSAQTGNTSYGTGALENNTTGDYNSAFGYRALYENTTGSNNTAHGSYALRFNTTGYLNTAIGSQALYANTTGYLNTAIGSQALYANTTGKYNTATGYCALHSNTTGYRNTAHGSYALQYNTTGKYNTATGHSALYYNTTGSWNTAVGYHAGPRSGYTYILNSTALGYFTQNTASNQVRIGNSSVVSIGGKVGWTTLSDARFKQEIKQDVLGLDFIKKLRPVSYKIDTQAFNSFIGVNPEEEFIVTTPQTSEYTTGFIAQEVEAIVRESGFTNFSGVDAPKNDRDYYGIRYSEFVVPLVKAVQELSDIVEKQQMQIIEQQK